MASEGLRVLGVARANLISGELPPIQHDFDFEFVGLIGLSDPIRKNVPDAVKECYKAGIQGNYDYRRLSRNCNQYWKRDRNQESGALYYRSRIEKYE